MKNRLLSSVLPALLALLSFPVLAQTATNGAGYWGHGWGWGAGHLVFGGLMMVLFWGGIILVIVLAVRWLGGGSARSDVPPPRKTALDILQERFARGEIDKEEFEERRRLLSE